MANRAYILPRAGLCRRNSIGDHIPAYLINTILALENGSDPSFRQECVDMLKECTRLIVDKFVENGLQVRACDDSGWR